MKSFIVWYLSQILIIDGLAAALEPLGDGFADYSGYSVNGYRELDANDGVTVDQLIPKLKQY